MGVDTSRQATDRGSYRPAAYSGEAEGEGLLSFAGVMLMVVSITNVIGGIAAIDGANFYVGNAAYQFGDLNTWGWVLLCTGVVQFLAGVGVFTRNQFARWLGVGFASLNMLAQFVFLPAFPLWCLAIIAVDTIIIYALLAYGGREGAV